MRVQALLLAIAVQLVSSQKSSPCPEIFSYEPKGTEDDRWYGVISLKTREELNGVWLRVVLDRPAELLGNWFGEATSTDNQEFTIKNPSYKLEIGRNVPLRFFIKYNTARTVPSLVAIRLNGKTICSADGTGGQVTPQGQLHISQIKPTSSSSSSNSGSVSSNNNINNYNTDSNSNSGGSSRPSTGGGRPTSSSSSSGSRPTGGSSSNNGGSSSGGSRPSRPSGGNSGSSSSSSSSNNNNRPSSSGNSGSSNNRRPAYNNIGNDYDSMYTNNNNNGGRLPLATNNNNNNGYNRNPSRGSSSTGSSSHNNNNNYDNNYNNGRNPSSNSGSSSTSNNYNNNRPSSNSGSNSNINRNPDNNYNSNPNSYGVDDEDDDKSNGDYFPGDFAIGSPFMNRPTSPPRNPISGNRAPKCGTRTSRPNPLISHGQSTSPGEWPWHAALYHSKGIQLMYTCGATLISDRHLLTAAHCVTKPHSTRPINSQNLLVYLGKYNLKKFGTEVEDREVSQIYVHPQYNSTVYFNDLAVLKLEEPVEITNYVRPCCLWEEDTELENVLNRLGTVVGWGFDENRQLSNELMKAEMPVVTNLKCIYSNREFFSQFTFEKTFCAGFRNGTSVCNGDSGGGMFFPKSGTSGNNQVWQLRGVVSVGVALQGQGVCDPSHYIVFTDVAKHLDWIREMMTM